MKNMNDDEILENFLNDMVQSLHEIDHELEKEIKDNQNRSFTELIDRLAEMRNWITGENI